jgi:hypothetical protein
MSILQEAIAMVERGDATYQVQMFYTICYVLSVLARQPSRAADFLLRSSRGGGWGLPLCIGKQAVGTYIYSLLYTHTGLLGRLL